jgi:hypothetical protein
VALDGQQLRRLIVRSKVLDPALKRAWLRVLPHMAEEQRRELAEILRLEGVPVLPGGAESPRERS